ncbi:MAG TPA: ABC transporter permease [Clostridia bacterium]
MKKLKRVIPFIILFIAWFIKSRYSNPLFFPKPEKVFLSFIELLMNGQLLESSKASFLRITVATFLCAGVSLPLGLLVYRFKLVDDLITPLTNVMRYWPVTAFMPLLMAWFGIDEQMKIMFLFLAMIFYFLPSVILCIKDVSQDLIDTSLTMGMSNAHLILKVILPASLPGICQLFLLMYGIGWTYVIIAEVINANSGLGSMMHLAGNRGRTDLIFVGLFTILIISYVFDTLGKLIIKKAFKWKYANEVED